MSNPSESDIQWEESVLSSFLDMVRTADGDFDKIDGLVKSTSDRESLHLIIERLLQYPQCQKAFTNRCSLGAIDLEQLSKLPAQVRSSLNITDV